MVEPFACAVRICRLAAADPARKMMIVGAGPIGLFTLQTAQVFGVSGVDVMDINPERLEIVEELGGHPVSSEEDLKNAAPQKGYDIAVDAVGLDVTRQTCMNFARPGGRVIFSGLHAGESVLPVNLGIRNELSLIGSFGYNPVDFETALDWLAEGKVDLKPWSEEKPLEEGQACFERLIGNPGKTAKLLLKCK